MTAPADTDATGVPNATPPRSGDPASYPLGRSAAEARRLMLQHSLYADATRQLFTTAGVTTGMRVLDVGSGAGDVALLLAELVGPSGEVVGLEVAPETIELATGRAAAAGVGDVVRFVQTDLRDLDVAQLGDADRFDAVVGRWVLMYLPDPAALLRRLVPLLRPGGIVAFQESDLVDHLAPFPRSPLSEQIRSWLAPDGFSDGPEARMGPKLLATFRAAGLATPAVRIDTPAGGGPDWPGYDYVAETVRSLLPFITALGLAQHDEVGIDTLATRLREEIVAVNGLLPLASVYGAWSTTPRETHTRA